MVRSVELSAINGRLWLAVTAEVPVETHDLDRARVVGVDLGIIHPYALAGPDGQAMIMSGRALRAEHRLHLADTKARQAKMASKHARRRARGSTPAIAGSRRWRELRDNQRRAEARHRAPTTSPAKWADRNSRSPRLSSTVGSANQPPGVTGAVTGGTSTGHDSNRPCPASGRPHPGSRTPHPAWISQTPQNVG